MSLVLAFVLSAGLSVQSDQDPLAALVEVLKVSDDDGFRLDILKGIRDGLKGRTTVAMPKGWSDVSLKLLQSQSAEVRSLAQMISITFGDPAALTALRKVLADSKAGTDDRKGALESLLGAKDRELPPILSALLSDAALRGSAIRALGSYEDPGTPARILAVYSSLQLPEKRDAINTLGARKSYAKELLAALKGGAIPRTDLTAASVRQLGDLNDAEINSWIEKEWGAVRPTPEARLKEIATWKQFLVSSPKGDPRKGRVMFAKTCMQCHTLFDAGGKVGPELTGANRQDMDYLLSNILDPSAVVGKDYQATTIRTKSERVVTGLIKAEDNNAVTLQTENDILIIPKTEIDARKLSEISMMPEGLLANMSKEDARNLVAYLQQLTQIPFPDGFTLESLKAAAPGAGLFNGKDLADWEGDPAVWSVDAGEIVGKGPQKRNHFLFHKQELTDFRLTVEIRITPHGGNSGIQVRSVPVEGGEARGCQCDAGAGWWGKLYEEGARGLLFPKKDQPFDGDKFIQKEDWNVYEIVAVGNRIKTALNGNLCTDYEDDKMAMKGRIGLQVHAGGPMEVRFRNFQLELNPKLELKTVK
ncbi:MAG TPA: family 16 glycoside hydrolase [Planctomycetota bacterium]|nr:family 16 glycoside hydrolase [Planctomycetota bacterium]